VLEELNKEQLEAVKKTDGPILVLAGAGSGKTKVLTTRIAYLINEKNISPFNILAITFTNKAAKEMKNRLYKMLGNISYDMQISTFHSFGLRIIKENYEKLGYSKNFTILDSDDTLTVIKKIMKEMNLDPKMYNPKAIKNSISGAKNELINPINYSKYANNDFEAKVESIYKKYETRLITNNSLDFDDLLTLPIKLFNQYPDVLKNYQELFKYILIDEYQDTNKAQYTLFKQISEKYKNICVVGDDAQSIYSFRGANYKNILNFEKDYKNTKVVLLEQNYRSTKNILEAANNVIKNNKQGKTKNLWTENIQGMKVKYNTRENEIDEAYFVTKEIKKLLQNNELREDIAVLYRTNAQSRNIEESLRRENIPYKVIGSFYFYGRKEIKDLIAYLKLIYNSSDDVSLTRIINVPKRGIGLKTIENLNIKAILENSSIYEAIETGKELIFKQIIEEIKKEEENVSLTELIDLILEKTGMLDELKNEKTLEADIRIENLEEFKTITKNFEEKNGIISLDEFLAEISLVSDVEEYKNNTDVITLMTIHSAKGLEFNNIFVIGLEEGLFPHRNSLVSPEEIEEERRLCYVAFTRAKKNLYLVNAKKRTIFGETEINLQSRFINEIGMDNLDIEENNIKLEKPFNKEETIDITINYNIGDKIIHEKYGLGTVVNVEKTIITIAFPHPIGIIKSIKGHKSFRKVWRNGSNK